jgi:CRP/FNR family transcriptional regulator
MGTQTALADVVREEFLSEPAVRRLTAPRRGHVLFTAGALAREIFYIESGVIKLEHATSDQNILIGVLGAGQLCGEAALIGEAAHQVTATTMEASTALAIPTDTFQRVCDRRPEVWRAVLGVVLECSAELQRRFVQLCVSDVRDRILRQLDVLASIPGGAPGVIHISQIELASMVGATRETTSTTLNALAREGLVTLGHRKLLLNARVMKAGSAGV